MTVVKSMCRSASWHLQIRQYHLQGDAVSQEYVLGVFAANVSDVNAIQQETGPTGIPKAYVYQVSPHTSLVALPSSIICLPALVVRLLRTYDCAEAVIDSNFIDMQCGCMSFAQLFARAYGSGMGFTKHLKISTK